MRRMNNSGDQGGGRRDQPPAILQGLLGLILQDKQLLPQSRPSALPVPTRRRIQIGSPKLVQP